LEKGGTSVEVNLQVQMRSRSLPMPSVPVTRLARDLPSGKFEAEERARFLVIVQR
jgi:hypothetical protein